MDLELDVRGDPPLHELHADGVDALGRFTLAGTLNASTGEVHFGKQYVGSHAVAYEGFLAGRAIRGTWRVGVSDGLFALWNAEVLSASDIERGVRSVKSLVPRFAQPAALVTAPLRIVTLVRHARLVSRFRRIVMALSRATFRSS
jgi:hypothetical protein